MQVQTGGLKQTVNKINKYTVVFCKQSASEYEV